MSLLSKKTPAQSGGFLSPLANAATFKHWHPFFEEKITDLTRHRFNYSYKPLLIYFYEKDWGTTATEHLRQLSLTQSQLTLKGATLLIITSKSIEHLNHVSWKENWSLNTWQDSQNELAAILKIYSEEYPSWNIYSGINENIALPALYLLDHSRQVVFSFPNEELNIKLPIKALYNELENLSLYNADQQSA